MGLASRRPRYKRRGARSHVLSAGGGGDGHGGSARAPGRSSHPRRAQCPTPRGAGLGAGGRSCASLCAQDLCVGGCAARSRRPPQSIANPAALAAPSQRRGLGVRRGSSGLMGEPGRFTGRLPLRPRGSFGGSPRGRASHAAAFPPCDLEEVPSCCCAPLVLNGSSLLPGQRPRSTGRGGCYT